MNRIVVSCESGLETLQIAELYDLGYEAETLKPAKVLVHAKDDEDVVRLNYRLRQANRVFLLVWEGEVETLEDVRAAAAEVDYSRYMESHRTFGVKGVREGTHDFTSMDVAREVGAAVVEHFLEREGVRVRAYLDDPEVQFYAELSGTHLMITVNTTGEAQARRHPRVFQHFAPLKPTLAAALLYLSSFRQGGRNLLDPMAGGGTIPAEACMMDKRIPAGYFREHFAFERLPFVPANVIDRLREEAAEAIRPCRVRIGASDRSQKSLVGMRDNFAAFGIADEICVWEDDAEIMAGVEDREYQLLITNPPFGYRIGRPRLVKRLYDRFPKAARDKGIDEIVLLTPNRDWICDSLQQAGYRISHAIRFLYGSLESFMIRAIL